MQRALLFAFVILASNAAVTNSANAQTTTRVSVATSGEEGNGDCGKISMSDDGRFVVFESTATNLVPGDTNGFHDVFLRDRALRTTTRVNVAPDGSEANADTQFADSTISADGRWVAFTSIATNLDPAGAAGLFVRDLALGTNTLLVPRISSSTFNRWAAQPALSADGRFVAYILYSYSNSNSQHWEVHVLDRTTGADWSITGTAAGIFLSPSISADGRYVAYQGGGGQTPTSRLFDRNTGVTTDVGLNVMGNPANAQVIGPLLSGDGRFVAFQSPATDLVASDTNNEWDVFVRDLQTGQAELASISSAGEQGNGRSDDGAISFDGRYVAFTSTATNLVPNDTNGSTNRNLGDDVFVRDRSSGETIRVSIGDGGVEGDSWSRMYGGDFTRDGRQLVFDSNAITIVPNDTNGVVDVFVWSERREIVTAVAPSSGSEEGGDLVHVTGENFSALDGMTVWFGRVPATLVAGGSDNLTVRTPPGHGVVDVSVSGLHGTDTLVASYAFVDPTLATRYGNVNVGRGDRENVLLLNGVSGDDLTRDVDVSASQPLSMVVVSPSSRSIAPFVVYGWRGVPSAATRTPLPAGLGTMVFATPFAGVSRQPSAIWNNLRHRRTLGKATAPSSPAPSILFARPSGVGRAARATFQGIISDGAAAGGLGFSVTNAIVLRVTP
ncbi:MAG: IPT/TIG domain-containing protein [Planctomycetes bacterium]|nr:IPT/TIG domain-containing protein [Planctomycetota bacterium]